MQKKDNKEKKINPPPTVLVRLSVHPDLPYGEETEREEALDYLHVFTQLPRRRRYGGHTYVLQGFHGVHPQTGEVLVVYKIKSTTAKRI